MRCNLKSKFLFVFFFISQLLVLSNDGEPLFIENCAICHTIGQGELIGPDLKYIHKNRTFNYFFAFVKNSQDLINSGDSIAVSIFQEYDESIMPETSLSESEIDEVWQFIQTFEGQSIFEYSTQADQNQTSKSWLIYFLIIIVIIGVLLLKRRALNLFFIRIFKRIPLQNFLIKRWKAVISIVLVLFILFELNSNGIFTGYQPKQPILFSHEIHCNQNKLSCKYCHYESYKGMHGGIPPLSTCMNCHKYIRRGTLTDTVEISKLYEWVGFDYKSKEYNKQPKQLGWMKVYNLPDHSRFNHRIHTKANVMCTECHGNVDEMEEIKQITPLTMKWCVDCHNMRQVALVGYYLENEIEIEEIQALSVEERANYTLRTDTVYNSYKYMGGLDCYKCHN